jgi:four helix bundle protein
VIGGSGDLVIGEKMSIEQHEQLRQRTKQFALRIIHLCDALPNRRAANVIGNQVLRSGTAVAANYRSAGRARSKAEFIAKLGIVVEEADETVFWLELLAEAEIVTPKRLGALQKEAGELLAIFSASRRTARSDHRITRSPDRPMVQHA